MKRNAKGVRKMVEDDPLISSNETAAELHLAPSSLATWRCKGRGPRFVKVGRAVFYRQSAIKAWLRNQEREPQAAHAR
jgi:predicted DNA-binding transcriptional regulator AlpA